MFFHEIIRVPGHHLHVFGSDAVGLLHHFGGSPCTRSPARNPATPGRRLPRSAESGAGARLPFIVSSASRRELVSSIAGEVGPCSAWPSEVGRLAEHRPRQSDRAGNDQVILGAANRSMPTRRSAPGPSTVRLRPRCCFTNSRRLAEETIEGSRAPAPDLCRPRQSPARRGGITGR